MKIPNQDEVIFTFKDVIRLFHEKKRQIGKAALLCGSLGCLFAVIQPIKYRSEATFKESAEQKDGGALLGALAGIGVSRDSAPQAAALMKSNLILKPLVSRFGLQITPIGSSKIVKAQKRIMDNLRLASGGQLDDLDPFHFCDVTYEGEREREFTICFSSPDTFRILSCGQEIEARLGEKVHVEEGFSFTLLQAPVSLEMNQSYRFSVSCWIGAVTSLRNSLQVAQDKVNRSISVLSLSHRNRHLGADLLNALMDQYQTYLKTEHDRIAEAQISFLVKRRDNLYEMLEEKLDEHMDYLRSNFNTGGFFSLKDEMKLLCAPFETLYSSSIQTDLSEDLIRHSIYSTGEGDDLFEQQLEAVQSKIFEMKGQKDLLQASMVLSNAKESTRENQGVIDLEKIRMDLDQTKKALLDLDQQNRLPFSLSLRLDPNQMVQSWAKRIEEGSCEKKDLVAYLQNLVRIYSVQEKILYERQFQTKIFPEFDGLDLATARQLLSASCAQLDRSYADIERYRHFSQKLADASFEIASLNAVFQDPVSKHLLDRVAELHLALSDEGCLSETEKERAKRELNIQRTILTEHLKQMGEMEEVLSHLCQDKIMALQQVSLDKMHHEISVQEQKLSDLIEQKKKLLEIRRQLYQKKMGELRSQMASSLPDKWRAERLLEFRSEMGAKMMESIGQLAESKMIGHHLHHVESKPLDCAYAALSPEKPKFALLFYAGAFLGAFATFSYSFFRKLYQGFPVTSATLQVLSYPFSGNLTFAVDGPRLEKIEEGDLQALRKWVLFVDQPPVSKVLTLLAGEGPDYSHAAAQLLAQSGRKVLLIRCDFSSSFLQSDQPGLLQALDEGALSIRHEGCYDVLPTGGYTRFGAEKLTSPQFSSLLEKLKGSYDHLLLYSRAPFTSAECEAFLRVSDKAAATITKESIEVLTPLMRWGYHEEDIRLTFFVLDCLV